MVRSLRATRGRGWAPARWGAFALSLLSNACLVTNDVEFERPTNPTIVWPLVPAKYFDYVPAVDPGCGDAGVEEMLFSVEITDLDVDERLYAELRGNPGVRPSRTVEIEPTMNRSPVRLLNHCQPKAGFLTARCNVVTLVVGPNVTLVQGELSPARAPDVSTASWVLLGPSAETPEADDTDCLDVFPDAGVL